MPKHSSEPSVIRRFIQSDDRILTLPFNGVREDVSRHWHHILNAHPLREFWKWCVHTLTKSMPSCGLKNALLRSVGVRIGKNVFIGQGASLDPQFPELITIGDNVIIGIDSHIMTHEITHAHVRLGKITIGKNALIGAMSILRSGVTIGADAAVGIGTVVVHDVEPHTMVLGGTDHIEKRVDQLP